jgi:hypothetical protein
MKFIDNTTVDIDWRIIALEPSDFIELMSNMDIEKSDGDRSEFLCYVESASKYWDVVFDNGTIIFCDKS